MDRQSSLNTGRAHGKWWRFSSYDVTERWIRPTRNARLEAYDPWEEYRFAWEDRAAADSRLSRIALPPYQRLFNLLDRNPREDSAKGREQIAGWCREFGLLGLLSHRVVAATFPRRWAEVPYEDDAIVPARHGWTRGSDGWSESTTYELITGDYSLVGSPKDIGKRVSTRRLPPDTPLASVHMRDSADSFATQLMPIGKALKPYFPDVPLKQMDDYDYPAPLSSRFWTESGEFPGEFLTCAYNFKEAVTLLSSGPATQGADALTRRRVTRAEETLAALASRTQQVLSVREDGSLERKWVSTSLLSSLATMAMNDLAEGTVRQCEARGCGRAFASSSQKAMYCSSTCIDREMKARYRARKKAKQQTPPKKRKQNG